MRTNPPKTKPRRITAGTSVADRKAAAQILYEGQDGATLASVCAEVGVSELTLKSWIKEGDWKRASHNQNLSERAMDAANGYKAAMLAKGQTHHVPAVAAEAAREVAEQMAVDVRVQVIERHRKEWAAPRKIIYEAAQQAAKGNVSGATGLAKLAKVMSETLTLIQAGESSAFGLGPSDRQKDSGIVIIERTGSVQVTTPPPDPEFDVSRLIGDGSKPDEEGF